MLEYSICFLAFIFTFYLTLIGKVKYAIYVTLFFIPYNTLNFRDFGINYILLFGIIVGYLSLRIMKKETASSFNYPYKSFIIFFFVLILLDTVMIFSKDTENLITIYDNKTKYVSAILFIIFFLSGLYFFTILTRIINSFDQIISVIVAFISSSFLLFVSWANFQFNISLPDFLMRRESGGGWTRFSGFWGDYELTNEYLFIVAILSVALLLHKRVDRSNKIIAIISLLISFPIAVTTGTRSLLIMIFIFSLALIVILFLFSRMKFINKVITIISVSSLFIILYFNIFSSTLIGERLSQSLSIYQSTGVLDLKNFQLMINRNYTETYLDIIKIGGVLGIGPLFVQFAGNSIYSWMVYHCLYYHIFLSFGLIGFIVFISFYFVLIKDLFKKILRTNDMFFFVLISLFISLLIDQIKINYLREPSHMLTYWFLFGIIAVVNKKDIFINN